MSEKKEESTETTRTVEETKPAPVDPPQPGRTETTTEHVETSSATVAE